MNTTVLALQSLYVKLGGTLTDTYEGIAGGIPVGDYALIPDVIQACTQLVSESGGSDGGGGAFVINVASNTMDKKWQEIYDAVDAGKVCAVKGESVEGQAEIGYVTSIFSVMGTYTVVCITTDTINAAVSEYAANAAGGYPAYVGTYDSALPAVSSADNGNVMTVVNGAWGKAAPRGGVLVVNAVYDEDTDVTTLDKTWKEIHDADFAVLKDDVPSGKVVIPLTLIGEEDANFFVGTGDNIYSTQSENGYPTDAAPGGGGGGGE